MRTPELLFLTTSFLFADHICHHQFQKKKTRDYMIFQSCSFEEQHAARHALLQSHMPPAMLFCRATFRPACSSAGRAFRSACSSADRHGTRHAPLQSTDLHGKCMANAWQMHGKYTQMVDHQTAAKRHRQNRGRPSRPIFSCFCICMPANKIRGFALQMYGKCVTNALQMQHSTFLFLHSSGCGKKKISQRDPN